MTIEDMIPVPAVDRQKVIQSLGGIYTSMYYIDLAANHFVELTSAANVHERIGAAGDVRERLDYFCHHMVEPQYMEEMLAFVDLSTLSQRLQGKRIVSKEYLSTVQLSPEQGGAPVWTECAFIECDRDARGELSHVLFTTQTIHGAKLQQLEAQSRLAHTNEELENLLEAMQVAYDAAEEANRAKSNFLSNMSHDIRTPMNGIIGMTAIAATHIDDKERVMDCLQKISRASKHLLSLINEVLDMSKIESGKVELAEDEFRLSDLVDNLLNMMSTQIKEHHHHIHVNIVDVEHEDVVGDSLRLQKVFTNLLSNAVKYTPDGGDIHLTITEKPCHQAKLGCYEFVFEDNGIGMTPEFVARIFEPFARAADERVSRVQGTGLGMPISRNIVRMMGGDIRVESTLGQGSRFTVTIFLKLQEGYQVDYERFIDLNVLVADDDDMSLESCCHILHELGMKADGVTGGSEAVALVTERHQQGEDYFACILDWQMPGMDGVATARAIRQRIGGNVPIIVISAYDWTDIEQEARAAGVDAFISKPLFRSRLVKTFSHLLGDEERVAEAAPDEPLSGLMALDLSAYRALLAEDNDMNAEIAMEILGMTGMEIERAADGAQAVSMLMEREDGYYDIVFMDIQMPRMNGYDAARVIRTADRGYCKQVPIIAMTANAFAEDVQAAKTVGMNEHTAKPLDLKKLERILRKWLDV
ncbi:MAG: hybrid sensor histidine kinase/response regulator [Anaerovibrio sp.]